MCSLLLFRCKVRFRIPLIIEMDRTYIINVVASVLASRNVVLFVR